MKRFLLVFGLVLTTASAAPAQEWQKLFDGKTLTGWEGSPHWVVKDDAITGVITKDTLIKTNTFLIWKEGKVSNFELKCKFRMEGGNSGIQYRSVHLAKEKADPFIVKGYQADIASGQFMGILYEERGRGILANLGQKVVIDETGKKQVVGSLGEKLLDKFDLKAWHDYKIVANGNHIEQYIDGKLTVDLVDHHKTGRALEGILALQIHVGGPMVVQFKDIELKRLPEGGLINP
ncbi:MAG: DUF1080 domain-containing protein [Planctomycetota bacterium]